MARCDFKILGVMNVTPDSFSDGGQFLSEHLFLERVRSLLADGADYIDLGGESTRPGATPVTSEEEWLRLEPKLDLLKSTPAPISLDTRKEDIALKAMEKYSISLVNSMSGVFSKSALKELLKIAKLKKLDLKFCAGHMHGSPETMQRNPLTSNEAVLLVDEFFKTSHSDLVSAGFEREHILLDPGIGFGKTDAANLLLMGQTVPWSKVYNLMLGVSRKGIIGRMLSLDLPVDLARERDPGSKMLEFSLALMGAKMIRTHDVRGLVHMRQLARGI
jgi:dihydropteroate synthase